MDGVGGVALRAPGQVHGAEMRLLTEGRKEGLHLGCYVFLNVTAFAMRDGRGGKSALL
jgi:hypothetical protein